MSTATLKQAKRVLELITQKEVSSEHLQRLLEGGFLADLLEANGDLRRDEFRRFLNLESLHPILTELKGIVIPDDATIKSLKDGGGYHAMSDYAREYLRRKGEYSTMSDDVMLAEICPEVTVHGPRNLSLVQFKHEVTSKNVETFAEERGLNIALAEDLLCVGAHPEYRKLQLQFPIVALGASAIFCLMRQVLCLYKWEDKPSLSMFSYKSEWPKEYRFLLVSKDKPSDA